jgi:hypothetical protein
MELSEAKFRGGLSAEEEQEWWFIWNDSEVVLNSVRSQIALEAARAQLKAAKKALKEGAGAGATGVTPARLPPASCRTPPLPCSLVALAQAYPQRAWSPRLRHR